jgi:hypothetical protein
VSAPIYRDALWSGASDPVVIRREGAVPAEWWMFYTQRRAALEGEGVEWVHGSRIGVAVSTDGGASWAYRGVVDGLDGPHDGPGPHTHWAPEVVRLGEEYHMYLSWIEGAPSTWAGHERHIVHFVSPDLSTWTRVGRVDVGSHFAIDAAVARTPDGALRMWFKDEAEQSTTWSAVSDDGYSWRREGLVVGGRPHEGPNVFELGGWWWLIVDEWRGQGVYRATDGVDWHRRPGLLLAAPGAHASDRQIGRHADVVVRDDGTAVVFYFTHPGWDGSELAGAAGRSERETVIHAALLTVENDELRENRDFTRESKGLLPVD